MMMQTSSEIDLTFTTLMGDKVEPETNLLKRMQVCKESGYLIVGRIDKWKIKFLTKSTRWI